MKAIVAFSFAFICLLSSVSQAQTKRTEEVYGWKIDSSERALEFIVQVDPHSAGVRGDIGAVFLCDVPEQLVGRIAQIVVRIGTEPITREPSLEDVAKRPLIEEGSSGGPSLAAGATSTNEIGWLALEPSGNLQCVVQLSDTKMSFMNKNKKESVNRVPVLAARKMRQIAVVVGSGAFPSRPISDADIKLSPSTNASGLVNQSPLPLGDLATLKKRWHDLEQQAEQMAEKIKSLQSSSEADRSELRTAIRLAFEARQNLQRAMLADLQRQVIGLQQSIESRDQLADQVIDRRLSDLLNPTLDWRADQLGTRSDAALRRARPGGSTTDSY